MTFVVTVRFPTILEPTVIRNYVNMAFKKYQKLCVESGKADYFGGVYNSVGFRITEIPDVDPKDLRSVVEQIKSVSDHFETVDK